MPGGKREDEPGHRERSLPPETLGRKPQLPGRLAPAHTSDGQTASTGRWRRLLQKRGRTGFPRGSKRRERALAARERGRSARPLEVCPQRRVLLDGLTDKSIGEALLRSGDGETCFKAAPATQLPASTGSGAATFSTGVGSGSPSSSSGWHGGVTGELPFLSYDRSKRERRASTGVASTAA